MLILDKPYVSDFLEETIIKLGLPVLKNEAVEEFKLSSAINFLEREDFTEQIRNKKDYIYTNSENPINWIANNLSFTGLPERIDKFKDKFKFRELINEIYPDFYYQKVNFNNLDKLDITKLKKPFIIKPAVGFFSMGVHKVNNNEEWSQVVANLKEEVKVMAERYPVEVINSKQFIIEENIAGREFAVDIYYDDLGEPVILNIFEHLFSSGDDVSDRVYITSKEIIEKYHENFLEFLAQIGDLVELRNFPMHVEFRIDKEENVVPIEVNPMRFAGWCTTDIAYYAYGINVYQYFFEQKRPDWDQILKDKEDKIYSIVVADLPKDITPDDIKEVDYNKFLSYFEKPLKLRKIDYAKHGVFAFLFAETSLEKQNELEEILNSDLKEYIIMG